MRRFQAITAGFVVAAGLALAGCGSSSSGATAGASSSADSPSAPTTSAASAPQTAQASTSASGGGAGGGCSSYTGGKNGVIRAFCDGTATATITLGGKTTTLKGGDCEKSGGYFAINIGVVAGPDFTGSKPDYFGAVLPQSGGAFSQTGFTGAVGGASFLATASGTVSSDFKTVTATGANKLGTPGAFSVTVTC
jgi:hypothetical protein